MRKWRVVGISFEHAHMGDLLREVHEHPNAEIVGISDDVGARMGDAVKTFGIASERVYCEIEHCVRETKPDLAILCPATARHADCVEAVAALGVDILLEKPFAASLADADRILAAVKKSGVRLAINWPLRWYPAHVTTKRLIDEGAPAFAMGSLNTSDQTRCGTRSFRRPAPELQLRLLAQQLAP